LLESEAFWTLNEAESDDLLAFELVLTTDFGRCSCFRVRGDEGGEFVFLGDLEFLGDLSLCSVFETLGAGAGSFIPVEVLLGDTQWSKFSDSCSEELCRDEL
jgi:hypothetical protein